MSDVRGEHPVVSHDDSVSTLLPSQMDNLFKHYTLEEHDWSGDVEATTGAFGRCDITSASIERYKSDLAEGGNLTDDLLAQAEYLVPGAYLWMLNNSGIIWVFAFDTVDLRDEKYRDLEDEYSRWVGDDSDEGADS